jgi:hypothetical protein
MPTGIVPFKTPQGHDELARRTRRLGQRHRTVLLLVDGRRSVDQVLGLARAAGVGEQHYRELVEMDLIAVPEDALDAPTMPAGLDGFDDDGDEQNSVGHVDLPIGVDDAWAADGVARAAAARGVLEVLTEEVRPLSRGRHAGALTSRAASSTALAAGAEPAVPSRLDASPLDEDALDEPEADPPLRRVDAALEQAREILLHAVRDEAPLAGQVTLIKLKRAGDRAELGALIDEVERHLSRPRKGGVTPQTLRHVRHLLGVPTSTSFTML